MIYTFELYFEEYDKFIEKTENEIAEGSGNQRQKLILAIIMLGVNSIVGTVLIYFQIVKPWQTLGKTFFYRFYSIVDLWYSFFNMIITVMFWVIIFTTDHETFT